MIDFLNNPSGDSRENRGSQTRVGTGNQCGGHGDDGGGMEVAWTKADLGDRRRRCILDILRRQNSLMGWRSKRIEDKPGFLGWISAWTMGKLRAGRREGEKLKNSAMDAFNLRST